MTLVEAALVITLLVITSAFAVTRFTGAETASNDRAAQASLTAVRTAQVSALSKTGSFAAAADLDALGPAVVGGTVLSTGATSVSVRRPAAGTS